MHIHADYANYVTDDKPSSGRSVTTMYTTDIGLAYDCTIGAPQRAPTRPHGLKCGSQTESRQHLPMQA